MGYPCRLSFPPGFFHVWIRGVYGVPPFPSDGDKANIFGRFLRETRLANVEPYAVSVMSTHYHAIVYAEPIEMAACFQELHSTYALGFNKRYTRFGHVFARCWRVGCQIQPCVGYTMYTVFDSLPPWPSAPLRSSRQSLP